jgi:hypothetical protein
MLLGRIPRLIPAGARQRVLHSEFAPEWYAIGVIGVFDAIVAAHIGLRVIVTWRDGVVLAIALAAMCVLRAFSAWRGGLIAEYFGLSLVAAAVLATLSYLGLASSGALVDSTFQAADRALGFDWLKGFALFESHPLAAKILGILYDSTSYQGLFFGLLLGLLDRKRELREVFWLFLIAAVLICAGAALYPALGPFKTFGFESRGPYLPAMEHLRSGRNLSFTLSDMTGVVSFPSFHTCMALVYIYGFRGTGAIGFVIALVNLAMLPGIPFIGGHYLVDMIAGAVVVIVSLGMVKGVPKLWAARHMLLLPRPDTVIAMCKDNT